MSCPCACRLTFGRTAGYFGPAADIFSLGVFVHWTLTGDYPIRGHSQGLSEEQVRECGSMLVTNKQPGCTAISFMLVSRCLRLILRLQIARKLKAGTLRYQVSRKLPRELQVRNTTYRMHTWGYTKHQHAFACTQPCK